MVGVLHASLGLARLWRPSSPGLTCHVLVPQVAHPGASRGASAAAAAAAADGSTADGLPPWITQAETMSPLLAAYDSRISVRDARTRARRTRGRADE